MKSDYPDQSPRGGKSKPEARKPSARKSLAGGRGALHLKAHKPSKPKMKY